MQEKLVSSVMHRKTCKLQTPTQLLLCMGCDCARQIAFPYSFARINLATRSESVASSVMRRKACKPLHSAGKTCKLCYARENQAVSRSMGKGVVFIFTAVSFFYYFNEKNQT